MSDLPLPPELAVDVEPFTLAELEEALELLRAGAADDPAGALASLTLAELDGDAETPPALARTAGFVIDNDGAAEWAMRHLAALAGADHDDRLQHEDWSRRVDDWLRHRLASRASSVAFFEQALERYALAQRAANPQRKTLNLPSGSVPTRAKNVGGTVVVVDEAAVIKWAAGSLSTADYEAVVKTTEKVMLGPLRKLAEIAPVPAGKDAAGEDGEPAPPVLTVLHAGEVIPGVAIELEEVSASVAPSL